MGNQNARLIEKDIISSLIDAEGGDSEIVDLNRASKFSCQAVYDVSSPGAKTFDSPQFADLVNQSLTYTSVEASEAANDITIEIVAPSSGTNALVVSTVDDAISIALASTAAVAATGTLNLGVDIVLTSVATGTARNTNTFTTQVIVPSANPTDTVLVAFSGTAAAIVSTITPNDGTNNPGDAASGTVTITDFADLLEGTPDSITIGTYVFVAQAGVATPGALTFQASGSNDDTATSLAVQINAHAGASVLVTAAPTAADVLITADAPGEGGNSIVFTYQQNGADVGATVTGAGTLEDGTNVPVDFTTAELTELINTGAVVGKNVTISGTTSFRTLQTATGGDSTPFADGGEGDGVVATFASGANFAVTSSGNAVKSAVNADSPGAADLVLVSGSNASVLVGLSETPLAGGTDGEVSVADSEITIPSHGYSTGLLVQLTTTGTLPTPFLTATDYFVIVVDSDTIQLAESLVDAEAGTFIEIEDVGSDGAVNTVTAGALAGASVTFQKSNDAENWIDIEAATSISSDGSVILEQPDVSYRYFKAVKGLTAGIFNLKCLTLVIGDPI